MPAPYQPYTDATPATRGFVVDTVAEVGRKGIPAAVLIPSGFAETGNVELQREVVQIARRHGIRLLGPNIYGYYYTPSNLCATFCTPSTTAARVLADTVRMVPSSSASSGTTLIVVPARILATVTTAGSNTSTLIPSPRVCSSPRHTGAVGLPSAKQEMMSVPPLMLLSRTSGFTASYT